MRYLVGALLGAAILILLEPSMATAQQPPITGDGGGGVDDSLDPVPRPSSSGGCVGDGACFAGVVAGQDGSGPGSGTSRCRFFVGEYDVVADELASYFWDGPNPFEGATPEPDDDVFERPWVLIACPNDLYGNGGLLPVDVVQLGDAPDAAAMRRVAEQAVVLPVPVPEFSPRAENFQIVGLDTWVWLDETQQAPIVATACVDPVAYACVTVTAGFVDVGADWGDGSELLLCEGGGTAYDFGATIESQRDTQHCGHVFTDAPDSGDTFAVQVGATWRVSYSCSYDSDLDGTYDSGCGGGFLGFIARLAPPVPLEVRDLQAVAVAN